MPVPNPALEMKKRKSSKERESIFWRIISNLTFFNICSMKLAFRRKQESLLKKMYENTPQWHHSFFDKCEFWERTLNLLASQIFYCDILKPLALLLLWKMEDVCVLKSVFFFHILITWLTTYGDSHDSLARWLAYYTHSSVHMREHFQVRWICSGSLLPNI